MKKVVLALGVAAVLAVLTPHADARGIFAIGLNFGIPICPRPVYAPVYYPYYPPYPVYVAPPPIYAAPPPVYVAPAPVPVPVAPVPPVAQPAPVVRPAMANSSSSFTASQPIATAPPPLATAASDRPATEHPATNRFLQQLSDPQEGIRANAAIELGRNKARQAVDSLCQLLSSDQSPAVRETAARALGLIGDVRALGTLQNAAQADNDRDVRRSAQFSAEVIRSNLREY